MSVIMSDQYTSFIKTSSNGEEPSSPSKMEGTHASNPSPGNEAGRKMFVGGLPWQATDIQVMEYFSQFGEVENTKVVMDQETGRCKGFGFVVFKESSVLEAVTSQEDHLVMERSVRCTKAEVKQGKIYVGKLPLEGLAVEDIKTYFTQFGPVVEVFRPVDRENGNEPKDFCFVTFQNEETARKVVEDKTATINDHQVDIRKSIQKSNTFVGSMRGRGGYVNKNSRYGPYGNITGWNKDVFEGFGGGWRKPPGFWGNTAGQGAGEKVRGGRGRAGGYRPY